jgi:hypothetical protein
LRAVLAKGLVASSASWPDVRAAYDWVRRAASILANEAGLDAASVRGRYEHLTAEMARDAGAAGSLLEAIGHFLKVTVSYWPGLFSCYDMVGLPRTNNDLEQFFGSYGYHERRAGGRKAASPGTVVRGSVRLAASAATRLRPVEGAELAPSDPAKWRLPRGSLDVRQATRTPGRRFRQDPSAYLQSLEESMINKALPP